MQHVYFIIIIIIINYHYKVAQKKAIGQCQSERSYCTFARNFATCWPILPRDAMQAVFAVIASVCPSVTRRYCIKMAKRSISNSQWQFTTVSTAAHHRTCRSSASRSPLLIRGGICVRPTVIYLQYRDCGRRDFSVAGTTVCNSLPDFIRDPTISLDCFRCSLKTYYLFDTSTSSALEVLDDRQLRYINLLTYLLTFRGSNRLCFAM